MELTSGKSLNIAPPGYQKSMDALRDMLNKEHGWADPQDPSRSQDTKQLPEKKLRAQGREDIQNWLEDLIVAGRISSRPDMVAALEGAGFELPRQGKTYLTVKDPDSETCWRLKGDIFHADWTREKTAQRAAEREHRADAPGGSERLAARSHSDLRDEYRAHVEKRRLYNEQRYPLVPGETERDLRKTLEVERGTDPSAENMHGGKERLAAKNRFLKLSAAVLVSAVLTLGGILFLNNQLRWALITSAFNQTTYTEFPVLIFNTKTGTYQRCQDIAGKLSCQPTE